MSTTVSPSEASASDRPTQGRLDSRQVRRRKKQASRLRLHLAQVGVVVLTLGAWQLFVEMGLLDSFDVSTPGAVFTALWQMLGSSELWTNVIATFKATILGFVIGSTLGVIIGLILGSSRFTDGVMSPFLAVANSMPRIALAPLFIIWFGLTMWAKVWLAVSLVIFILIYNTKAAAQTVDVEHDVLSRMLNMGRLERFRKVVLPTCMPAIMAGLRLSVVFALLGVIASEMIGARDGLGQLAIEASSTFQVDDLFAILLVIAGMAVLMNTCLNFFEQLTVRWKNQD